MGEQGEETSDRHGLLHQTEEVQEQRLEGYSKWLSVALLCVMTAFLFADQNVMAPNLTAIAEDFGFTPEERDRKLGGDVAMVFFLVGAPVSVLIGYMTDKVQRNSLFCAVVFLGEAPCLATLLVTKYWHLVFLRALTGIAIGGAMPLIFSMLGDIFGIDRRAMISSILSTSIGLGISFGQFVSGMVGPDHGWRMPFAIVSLPSIFLAVLAFFLLPEPARGCTEEALRSKFEDPTTNFRYKERINWHKSLTVWHVRTNLLVFAQGAIGCLPWGMIFTFLNDFLSQEIRLSVQDSTAILTALNIGGSFGAFCGGFLGQYLFNKRPFLMTTMMGTSTILGIAPLLFLVNLPSPPSPLPPFGTLLFVAALTGFVGNFTGPNIRAILLNCNTPETRGTTFALYNLCDDLGKGFGPAIIAAMIVTQGRVAAFNTAVVVGWIGCGCAVLCIGFTMEADAAKVQEKVSLAAKGSGSGAQELELEGGPVTGSPALDRNGHELQAICPA
mmetsp:Transcript_27163/g.64143  ORF Transcript_27163/g.64143 Transcript_27163/m.64143 type:complete len:499 (-) Transcript_27163:58-1554(-)